ncbi:DUF6701 domain-containing protein [Ectothiorhodospira variabilis]|uniref:DUF6701 domain-containing protein n=1 Tax=Ectothiorhodospira variabilis TaxID=505694 RepID=UPI001EFA5014|nr:DUF6701 domain-containing protein [Ectothiorhodospira variabilis]MCG5498542.1 hypothetical protein [Ectothiorhodospira variabilis]
MIRIHPASVLRSGIVILAAVSAPFSHASSGVKYEISGAGISSIGQMDADCFKDDLASKYIYYGDTLRISFDLMLKDYDVEDERPEVTTNSFEFKILPNDPEPEYDVVGIGGWGNGDSRTIDVQFTIGRNNDTPDAPQSLKISVQSIDGTAPTEPVLVGDGDAIEVRYGRLRLDNALGRDNTLSMPWRTEYWTKGSYWKPFGEHEGCTRFVDPQNSYTSDPSRDPDSVKDSLDNVYLADSKDGPVVLIGQDLGPGSTGELVFGVDNITKPGWFEVRFASDDVKRVFGEIDWARLSFGLHAGDENRVFTLEVP